MTGIDEDLFIRPAIPCFSFPGIIFIVRQHDTPGRAAFPESRSTIKPLLFPEETVLDPMVRDIVRGQEVFTDTNTSFRIISQYAFRKP
jgi:hypothetical protein